MLAIQVRLAAREPPPVHEVLFAGRLTDFYAWAIPKPGSVLVGSAFGQVHGVRERFDGILAWYRETFGLGGEMLDRSARRLTRPRASGSAFPPGPRGPTTGSAAAAAPTPVRSPPAGSAIAASAPTATAG